MRHLEDQSVDTNEAMLNDLLLLLLLFAVSVILLLRRAQPKKYSQLPGPSRLPLIGNLHQLGSLPHHSMRALSRKCGPVMLLHLGRVPTVVFSSPAAAAEILKTRDLAFATRPSSSMVDRLLYGGQDIAFAKYGDSWRQLKRLCTIQLLSSQRVSSFRSIREEETAFLVETICAAAGTPVNVAEMIVSLTSSTICRAAFGNKYTDGGSKIQALIAEWMELLGLLPLRDHIPTLGWLDWLSGLDEKVRRTAAHLDTFVMEVLEARSTNKIERTNDAENLIDRLVAFGENGDGSSHDIFLSRDCQKAVTLEIFQGGTVTSFTTMEWAMAELVKHPKEMEKVQEEIRRIAGKEEDIREDMVEEMVYLKAVIKEVLRLHPPVPLLLPRECMKDTEVLGYVIPQGARVLVNVWAIGRDPALWGEEAEEFLPERFLDDAAGCGGSGGGVDLRGQHFQYLPFGAGRRICPGIDYAMSVMELALANLLFHFDWELPQGETRDEMDMVERSGLVLRKRSSLVLVPKIPSHKLKIKQKVENEGAVAF